MDHMQADEVGLASCPIHGAKGPFRAILRDLPSKR